MFETTAHPTPQPHEPPSEKMPGHWLLAKMGKRVLRPGGLELTRELLAKLSIGADDDVIEFAPGLGITAQMTLARNPRSYTAIERDANAFQTVKGYLSGPNQRCVLGSAEEVGLPDGSASVVYGEALLSMQSSMAKARIVAEAARLLLPGGRYGIHELCLVPDDVGDDVRLAIQGGLSSEIHAGIRLLTRGQWRALLEKAGFKLDAELVAPMHLLEPLRLVRDEGLWRALRFCWNMARRPVERQRVLAMRRVFRKYRDHLAAIALVGSKTRDRTS